MSAALDRSRPPAPGPPRRFDFPAFEHRRLGNGVELWLAPIGRLPLVELRLVLDAGSAHDPAAAPGLAHFAATALDEGTEERDSRQIADTVERLGGYLASGADWDALEIGCSLLSEHLDTGLALVAEIARRPTFPAAEVNRLRGQLLAEIERRERQPAALAGRHLMAAIYGDTVYGRPRIGTAQSLAALDRPDLAGFHRRRAAPPGAAFVLCGDFDPGATAARLADLLGDWPQATDAEAPAIAAPPADHRRVLVVDRPGAQTELRLGHAGPPRRHPDYLAATVVNSILGGKFMSRINLNLRERHGYTYHASSYFDWRRGPGPFVVSTAVATEHAAAAAREVLSEIERLRGEPVPASELEETRSYLIGVFPYSTQRLAGLGSRLEQLAIHRLPRDYYRTWIDELTAVTADDVQRCAGELLQPDRLAIVAVGPADQLAPGLEALGELEIVTPRAIG